MGDLLKGIHLLPQGDFETAVENNQIDDDVIYVTPEDFSSLSREQTKQIAKNTEDIAANKLNIENNAAEIELIKNSSGGQSSDLTEIKNSIQEIILRDINQDSRLDNIENNYASKDFVSENGGKIDKITVNGVEQSIINKTVNVVVPDTSAIEDRLAKTVNLDEAQTITGPKTFTEHIYLANSDGTIDRISHLNNNFIIHSGATNSAVLNIDEGLNKIYAFNEELAFKSDIAEAAGTTVYVDGTAVASLSFSTDPQTQIKLLAESIDDAIAGLGTVFDLKGTKETLNELPSTGNTIGDVWYVSSEQVGYIWLNDGTGERWERFGAPIELSGYATTEETANLQEQITANDRDITRIDDEIETLKQYDSDFVNVLVAMEGVTTNLQEQITSNDTDIENITNAVNAIPDWAKQATKPEYDYSEIKNTPESADINFDAINFAEEERQKSKNLLLPKNIDDYIRFRELNTLYGVIEPYLYTYTNNSTGTHGVYFQSTDVENQFLIKAYNNIHYAVFKNLKPNTKYTFSFNVDKISTMIFMGVSMQSSYVGTRRKVTFTTDDNGEYSIRDGFRSSYADGMGYIYASELQLEEGDVSTAYMKSYGHIVHSVAEPITLGETKIIQNDTVIEYWLSSDGLSWYRKWASGWKECGVNATNSASIALPITFNSLNYTSIVTQLTEGQFSKLAIYNKTRSSLTVEARWEGSTYTNATFSLYCCGY